MGKDSPAPTLGYPDTGAGLYSRMLPYKDWFEFNCAQRVHQNNVEHLSWTLPVFFINGIFFPRFTVAMGGVVLVGRELYRIGYMSPEGPTSKIREAGAIPLNVAELLCAIGVGFVFLRYQFGGFFSRRKLIQSLTKSKFERAYSKLQEDTIKGFNEKTIKTHSPGEMSDIALHRERKLKGIVPTSRFDR